MYYTLASVKYVNIFIIGVFRLENMTSIFETGLHNREDHRQFF